jgi:AraC family transcriptional regulator
MVGTMNNIERFDELIKYIEIHLTEEINYDELARILAVSEQSMQRIFIFITNMSLAEYIRKRRLSKAYEELKNSNMTPVECRKSNVEFMQFPVYKLNQINAPSKYSYKIEEINGFDLYAYRTPYAKTKEDFLYRIRELYQNLKEKNLFENIVNRGMYGVTFKQEDNTEIYYVGCKEQLDGAKKIKIKAGKYVVFNCGGAEQSNIAPLIHNIYTQFILSTNLNIDLDYCFEYYEENENCYVYIHIKD